MKLPFELIKAKFGDKKLVGAEIGVFCGDNATDMVNGLNFERLYLIDPFPSREDMKGYTEGPTDGWYPIIMRKFRPYSFVKVIRNTSLEAVKNIDDGELDFCYIDGNHLYHFVKKDLLSWYPKVKEGGFIGGHDWTAWEDVRKAVTDVCVEKKYNLQYNDDASGEWWIWK